MTPVPDAGTVEDMASTSTVSRLVSALAPALMIAALSVATGLSVKAHNLTVTSPNSDGDMFGFGPVAVVLLTIVLGLPVLVYTLVMGWRAMQANGSTPASTRPLWVVTAWTASANLAVAAVSWLLVSDSTMYRPASIDRATDAVVTAGVGGVVGVVLIGGASALAVRQPLNP